MKDLILTAVKAYERHCLKNGIIPQEPSLQATKVGRKYVYLYNSFGEVAKYDFKENHISC